MRAFLEGVGGAVALLGSLLAVVYVPGIVYAAVIL